MTSITRASLATALLAVVASTGAAQPSIDALADFDRRLSAYVELRSTLETGVPARAVTADPAAIERAVVAMADAMRRARGQALEGDIFTLPIQAEFKKVLSGEMTASAWAAIMDDNPGELELRVTADYPDGRPFSTVPGGILARLPPLPDDIQYRFLGRHLILYDVRANVVLDRIPYAIAQAPIAGKYD